MDDDLDFLFASLNQQSSSDDEKDGNGSSYEDLSATSLPDIMNQLATTTDNGLVCSIIQRTMGNMALCRGANGERLFQAGVVGALHARLVSWNDSEEDDDDRPIRLVLQAVRDLACGHANVRTAFHDTLPTMYTMLLSSHKEDDEEVNHAFRAALLGALRNVSHSHRPNCIRLLSLGLADYLVNHILNTPPPSADDPSRETYFRAAGTLLNMAEKCERGAIDPSTVVVDHLLRTFTTPILHVGLLRLLRLHPIRYKELLDREAQRKLGAQERERRRKERKLATENPE